MCATTDVHHEIAIAAARAGRHVIVEKPLTGYFGESTDPVLDAVARAGVTLCYAEDFNITPSPTVMAYAPDAAVWGDEYISEKVETKAGWQFPAPEEDWMRGYPQELEDFVDAIRARRPPLSDVARARDVVEVIYAGYVSAATGRRVEVAGR